MNQDINAVMNEYLPLRDVVFSDAPAGDSERRTGARRAPDGGFTWRTVWA